MGTALFFQLQEPAARANKPTPATFRIAAGMVTHNGSAAASLPRHGTRPLSLTAGTEFALRRYGCTGHVYFEAVWNRRLPFCCVEWVANGKLCRSGRATSPARKRRRRIKFDGYRLQAHINFGQVKLFTRGGLDWTKRFTPIVEDLIQVNAVHAVIDGELVVQKDGRPNFSELQADLSSGKKDLSKQLGGR